MAKRAGIKLPDRCIKCNGPRDGKRIKTRLFWHPPLLYLLIVINPIIYYLVAMHVRQEAVVSLSLCRLHRERQKLKSHLGYLILFATVLCFVVPIFGLPDHLVIASVLLGLSGLAGVVLWASFAAPMVRATQIQSGTVRIKGVSSDYTRQIVSDNFVPAVDRSTG